MKPVIVQTLIQAAKKRRSPKFAPIERSTEDSSHDPRRKDRSSNIVVIALILFIMSVLLFNSVDK